MTYEFIENYNNHQKGELLDGDENNFWINYYISKGVLKQKRKPLEILKKAKAKRAKK